MWCRGIRGATTVEQNTREDVLAATQELLQKMIQANRFEVDDIACVLFSTTSDINAEFPALAAREMMGWFNVAMLCGHEIDVPGSLSRCLRILMLVNTEKSPQELVHVYIKGAQNLRSKSTLSKESV